jgi:ureidoglycolate hydrolase
MAAIASIPDARSTEMHSIIEQAIPAQALDPAAFRPYGEVIQARAGAVNQFDSIPYDPAISPDEPKLSLCNGQPRLWIMHLKNRGVVFTKLARHRRVSQCLGAMHGKEWFIAVAPPQDFADDVSPQLEDVAVFRVPGEFDAERQYSRRGDTFNGGA